MAIKIYVDDAYPVGGSDCAQTAREALLNTAQSMLEHHDESLQQTWVSKRQRVPIKAAIHYYLANISGQQNQQFSAREDYMLSVFSGGQLTDAGYKIAEERDINRE